MQTSNQPDVTAVIPTYNRAATIVRAVDSVLAQTAPVADVVVVDDGSTDHTVALLAEKFGSRIRVIQQENRGVSAARNAGARAASTPLIAYLDSDDEWLPGKIEQQRGCMNDPRVIASFADWAYSNSPQTSEFQRIGLNFQGPTIVEDPMRLVARPDGGALMIQSMMVRRAVFLRVGGFDERMRVAEDTRLIYRLALEGFFAMVPTTAFLYHLAGDENHLYQASSPQYLKKHTNAAVEILAEAYARAWDRPALERRLLRRGLSYFLSKQAQVLSSERHSSLARRRAWESLALGLCGMESMKALGILLSPTGYRLAKEGFRRRKA